MATFVFDANDRMILDVGGWGHLQKIKKGDEIQDQIAEEIVKLLNNL